jgi:YD repeat-containing protein
LLGTTTYERETGSNFVTAVTDALGRRTNYTYDTPHNVTSVTRLAGTADAVTTTYTYEPIFNQVVSITDLNHTTSFAYDGQGRLTTITNPLSQHTTPALFAVSHELPVVALADHPENDAADPWSTAEPVA